MRNLWQSIMILVLCVGLIVGCSSNNGNNASTPPAEGAQENTSGNTDSDTSTEPPAESTEPVEISFYYPVAVGGPVTKIVDQMAADFTKENPNIIVKPVYTGSYADTSVKVQTAVQGGTPPEAAVVLSTDLFTLIDMDAIMPLDDLIAQDGGDEYLNDFFPGFMTNSQTEGKTWSIPFQRSTIVLYYNKDAFREVGLDPEQPPTNWSELTEYAQKLTKDGRWGIEIPASGFTYWLYQTFALQNGTQLANPEGTKVNLDNPENVEALEFWLSLSKDHKVMPEGITEWGTVPTDFLEGKTAMMFHTTGNLTNVKNNATFDFGVSFLPANKSYGSPTGGGNFYMFKDTEPAKQDATWKFIKWMTAPERAAQWSIDTGYVATRKSAYETDVMKTYVEEFPAAAVARDQLEYSSAELSTHNNGQVTKIVNDHLQAALTGNLTPAEALKKAQEEAEKALAAFNK